MSSDAWKKENTVQINLRLSNGSNIAESLREMQAKTDVPISVFAREAIREKLVREGFLTEKK